MATRTFDIEINGVSQSVSAVDSLLKRLDELEEKLNGLGGNVDLGTMRSDLQSIRTQLQGNVDEWDNISDRIEDATNSVVQLERAYDRVVNPFDEGDISRYAQQVDRLEDSVEGVADASKKVKDFKPVGNSARESTNDVDKLANSIENVVKAEDQLGNKLTINVAGMSLEFDNVNQAIGLFEDKLGQLAATGQQDSAQFKEITEQLVNLKQVAAQTDNAIENAFSGGLQNLVSGVSVITSAASIGQGFSQLFGLDNSAIDESIQKFTSLSLILQGFIALQQQMNQQNNSIVKGFKAIVNIAQPLTDVIGGFTSKVTGFKKLNSYLDTLQAKDLSKQIEQARALASVDIDTLASWDQLINKLNQVKDGLGDDINTSGFKTAARELGDLDGIAKEVRENFEAGIIDAEQFQQANEAISKFKESLSADAVEAGNLTKQFNQLGVFLSGTPQQLNKVQKGFLAARAGVQALGAGIKALMRSTIILGLLQMAVEAVTWAVDKLVDLFKWVSGDDTLVDQLDTQRAALDATKKSVEDYNKELEKLASEKAISTYTRLTEGAKEYEKALNQLIQTQQSFNKIISLGEVKSLSDNLDTNDTLFTGADIKNVEDFTKQFNLLSKAVSLNVDRVKALKEESTAWYEIWKGQWWNEMWQTAGDARADLSEAEKAVISDIQYRINSLDLSKGIDEVKKFIDVIDTPMYQISLANIEKLFPENEYAKVLQANIQQIRDYYNQISQMQAQAELEAQKTRDQIGKNNIAAIRNRFTRERAELKNNMELELRDAADNEELKASIRAKYATQEQQLLRSQGNEIRGIQNQINNNKIEAMQDGLKKQLAQLEQNRKQEIQAARDSEILVGQQIAAINAKYNKLILDAKREFYENRKKLLEDYSKQYKALENEIYQMEYEIATSRIQNRTTDQLEALGFTDESIENIRAYYDKVRDVQNTEAQRLAEANKERTSLGTDRDIDTENQRNKDRLKQIEDDYKEGLLTKEQYDKAIQDETDIHYKMLQTITRKGEQSLIDIQKEADQTVKNNNATAINERINALNEMYSDIQPQVKTNSLGIIDYKSTRAELKTAKAEYSRIFQEIAVERDNLEKQFANKEITFVDYRAAKKDLDNLEKDVKQSTKDIGMQLDQLITYTVQSITQYVSQYVNVLGDLWSTYNEIQMMKIEQEQARLEEEYDMLEEAYKKQEDLTKKHTDKLADIEDELKTSRGDRRAHLIEQLNMERAAMLESLQQEQKIQAEKDANQKKQDALEKKRREQEKKNSIVQATINTYTAMTNALAVQPWFVGLALSAVALAMGLAQVAMIKKQKYAKGGLLVGKSHKNGGIPVGLTGIEVEGNEYVVNKKSTEKNLPLIDYINSSNKRLTKDDLIRFYDSGRQNVNRTAKSKFADGGLLPNINMPTSQNEIVITDDRPVVVQVVDIVNKADNYRQVQVLAGLEGSNSI